MWFIGVEVEQGKSAPPAKKNPGSPPASQLRRLTQQTLVRVVKSSTFGLGLSLF